MPQQNDTEHKNDGAGAGAGQGAGAGEGAGAGDGGNAGAAGAGAGQGAGAGEETVTIKKSDLEKLESDKENYRVAAIGKKADERKLGNEGAGAGAGAGQGGGGQSPDETKVREIAKAESTATLGEIYKANENRAKRQFLKRYGEYMDDTQWVEVMSRFTSRRGKATVEDILEDLDDAVLLHKKDTGKLDEHLRAEHERGVRDGRIQAQAGGQGAGGVGDRGNGGGQGNAGTLSPAGEIMARAMHVDPAKAAKADPARDNVIDVFAPKNK